MVAIERSSRQRRSSAAVPPPPTAFSNFRSSSCPRHIASQEVPFGGADDRGYSYQQLDDRDDHSTNRRSSSDSTSRRGAPDFFWVSDIPHRPSSSRKNTTVEKSIVQMVYCVALLSWIAALYSSNNSHKVIHQLNRERSAHKLELAEQQQTWTTLKDELRGEITYVENLEKTHAALVHETRLLTEFADAEFLMSPTPRDEGNMIGSWLEHRRHGLEQRLYQLQHYLQTFSRREVRERFGRGPHRVKFTVGFMEKDQKKSTDEVTKWKTIPRDFTVELAPLSEMPHSIHFFLEMMRMKIWDNTVFVHHEEQDHVMTAIPIDYNEKQMKHHHLAYLGWKNLGFPEFSPQYSNHEQYTIGFSNLGPQFYINTLDNAKIHGPGKGQHGETLLDSDADPCFAKIIEGTNVVDDLIKFGLSKSKTNTVEEHPWAARANNNGEHTVTQILRVEMV